MKLEELTNLREWYKGEIYLNNMMNDLKDNFENAKELSFKMARRERRIDTYANNLGSGYYFIILTDHDKNIIGGGTFTPVKDKIYTMSAIYLIPEFQGLGIGTDLYVNLAIHFNVSIINSEQLSDNSEKLWLKLTSLHNSDHKIRIWDNKEDTQYDLSEIGKTLPDGTKLIHPKNDDSKIIGKQRFFLILNIIPHPIKEIKEPEIKPPPGYKPLGTMTNSWYLNLSDKDL